MKNLIQNIHNRNFNEAESILEEKIVDIMEQKLHEMKKAYAAKMSEQMGIVGPTRSEKLRSGVLEEEPEDGEESSMARSELNAITKDAKSIMSKIKGNKELEAWAQSKITKSADYLNAVSDYMDNEEKQIEEMSNLKDADNLQIKNMQKSFGKDGAIERIMSPVNRDPKFTKDQSKKPRDSYGVSDDKQNRGLPPSSSGILNTAKEYLRKNVPSSEIVKEEKQLDEARIGIVKARIRGGKIQRRKKVSNVAGYKLQGGQLTRMSAAERRKRKLGARRAKIKRKSKMSRTLMKRRRSLMKRKAMGL
jgi:hypothetical protein